MAEFQERAAELEQDNVTLIAASTDEREHATQTVEKLGLSYPVAYGLPLESTAETLRAFYETRRGILHATGFVVRADGTVGIAVYSTSAIGRLTAEDTIRIIRFWRAKS